jgi:predicted AlkP superfamily phosphohydrolase/phosphomutase
MSIVRPRILAFAFSEASFELVDRWSASGELPTFKHLRDTGTWGQLTCAAPYITPSMWSTILTGTNAGRHGVYDFWQRGSDGRIREVDRRSIKQPCLWDMLAASGVRSGFFNVPLTYPPPRIPGFVISGQDAPGAHADIAEPRTLYAEIIEHFGRLPFKEIFPGGRRKQDYLELFDQDAGARSAVLEHVIRTRDEPVVLIYNSATAVAQHYFWSDISAASDNDYHDIVLRAFQGMDRLMARVIDAAQGEVQVFAFSECGVAPQRIPYKIHIHHDSAHRPRIATGLAFSARCIAALSPPAQPGARRAQAVRLLGRRTAPGIGGKPETAKYGLCGYLPALQPDAANART